jgi:hypothetical protein
VFQEIGSMRYQESEITSIGSFVEKLKGHAGELDSPIWYRGQANASWSLVPRILRENQSASESYYLNRFKQDASLLLSNQPKSEFEWLFLLQHYGLPTRLLDWSESPLTALYFATTDENNANHDGALWVLLPTELNKVSRFKPAFEFEVPSFEDEQLKNYQPSVISAESRTELDPMAAIAPRNSPRMQSQQGVFTICHRGTMAIENVGNNPRNHVWKYTIPATSKTAFVEELKWLGVNRFQLFPELESLSRNLR